MRIFISFLLSFLFSPVALIIHHLSGNNDIVNQVRWSHIMIMYSGVLMCWYCISCLEFCEAVFVSYINIHWSLIFCGDLLVIEVLKRLGSEGIRWEERQDENMEGLKENKKDKLNKCIVFEGTGCEERRKKWKKNERREDRSKINVWFL